MSAIPADLQTFLNEHRDSREYRRALAVKLALQGYLYATICEMLDVTPPFVSQAKTAYETAGTDGLQLKYQGGQPFLTGEQRQAVITWLKAQQIWSVELLRSYVQTSYAVVYKSKQSYYEMLAQAGITYKRAQARNPKHDAEQVAAKKKPSRSF